MPEAGVGLGIWSGRFEGIDREWLRCYDAEGRWLPTGSERQEEAEQRAARADRQAVRAEQQAARERRRTEQADQRAENERQRAEQADQWAEREHRRAERLAARLRALGIDPGEES